MTSLWSWSRSSSAASSSASSSSESSTSSTSASAASASGDGDVGSGVTSSGGSVFSGGVGTSASSGKLGSERSSDMDLRSNSLGSESLDQLSSNSNILGSSDSGESDSEFSVSGSHGGLDLESDLSLLGHESKFLGTNLELSSVFLHLVSSVSGNKLVSPLELSLSEGESPLSESESRVSNSSDDVLASARSTGLDSDHFLSLVAPNKFGFKFLDWSFVGLFDFSDLLFVDVLTSLDLNGLDDVVPSDALVLSVDVSLLGTSSVSVLSNTVSVSGVGSVSGTGLNVSVRLVNFSFFSDLLIVSGLNVVGVRSRVSRARSGA